MSIRHSAVMNKIPSSSSKYNVPLEAFVTLQKVVERVIFGKKKITSIRSNHSRLAVVCQLTL